MLPKIIFIVLLIFGLSIIITGGFLYKKRIVKTNLIISEIQESLRENLNFDILFNSILRIIGNHIKFDFASIAAVDYESKKVINKYIYGKNADYLLNWEISFEGKGLYAWVVKNKEPLIVNDVTKDERYIVSIDTTRSELCVPIIVDEKVLCIINLESDKINAFSENHIRILHDLTPILSVAYNNSILYEELEKQKFASIKTLARAIEAKDPYTENHSSRVQEMAVEFARFLELSIEETNKLKYAAILHDIGKIGIPSEILNKPGKLTYEEYDIVKRHPVIGYTILNDLSYLEDVREIILQHHERIDGKGYPCLLKGEEIHYLAKIINILDSFEAMTGDRPYRSALTKEAALREIHKNLDYQFDRFFGEKFIQFINLKYS